MYVKVINPKTHGKKAYNNSGSCAALVNYLCKEDKGNGLEKELFFSHDSDHVPSIDVVQCIDNNCAIIDKDEAKFYSLVVAPRPDEMEHIKNDKERLKAYVRDTMDIYAQNFNKKDGTSKNLTGKDLVYFAKIEENRYYKGTDEEVKQDRLKKIGLENSGGFDRNRGDEDGDEWGEEEQQDRQQCSGGLPACRTGR